MPIISIIIPVYNTGKYLSKILEDINNQSFKDYEIIVVDDGSDKETIDIENEFAKKIKKLKLINQSNQGVSAARNMGLKHAKGKYILFLDSDDCIHSQMLEVLYNNIIKYQADISICNYLTYKKELPNFQIIKTKQLYYNEEIIKALITNQLDSFLWNKLFKKSLFKNLQFPIGKIYEDFYLMSRLFMKAKVIVKDQSSLYGYYQRENSYTNTYSKTKNDNYIEVYKDRYNYLQNKIEKDLLDKHYLFCVYSAYLMISKSHLKELLNDKNMQVEYKYFRQKFSIDSKLSLKRKILYILLFLNKQIFYFVISRCFKDSVKSFMEN